MFTPHFPWMRGWPVPQRRPSHAFSNADARTTDRLGVGADHRLVRRSLLCTCLAAPMFLSPSRASAQTPRLQGDGEAISAVQRMLERLGGREIWARTRSLYTEFEGWRTSPTEPVVEKAWWDFAQSRQRYELEARSFYKTFALSPQGSWSNNSGMVTRDDSPTHRARLDLFPFLTLPSLHGLAAGDARVILGWAAPNRVIMRSIDGRERSWWEIDESGAPIRWGTVSIDGSNVEYVYGPLRPFGNVNYPAWGAKTDGSFRFNYTAFELSSQSIAFSVAAPSSQP